MQASPRFIQDLILEAIRQRVAAAIQSRSIISADDCAVQIAMTYPAFRLDEAELINEIAYAAAKAGVAVEVGAPKQAV